MKITYTVNKKEEEKILKEILKKKLYVSNILLSTML